MSNSLSKSSLWTAFAILATLNVLDAATTAILVQWFGAEVEVNPIVRHWIEVYGVTGIFMIKFVVVAFLGLTISAVKRYGKPRAKLAARISMWIASILLMFIVLNNVILVVNTINT